MNAILEQSNEIEFVMYMTHEKFDIGYCFVEELTDYVYTAKDRIPLDYESAYYSFVFVKTGIEYELKNVEWFIDWEIRQYFHAVDWWILPDNKKIKLHENKMKELMRKFIKNPEIDIYVNIEGNRQKLLEVVMEMVEKNIKDKIAEMV